jgi:rare lipoprotein A
MPRPHTVRAAGAAMATSALTAIALLATGAPSPHPAAARAAVESARPGAGGVAIARRRLNVLAGRRALVAGRIAGAGGGRSVALQRRGGAGWRTIDRDRTTPGGAFAFRFRPHDPGSAVVRVRAAAASEHVGRLNVYRRALASWYGPGLYGGHLGCGGTLTPHTLGVASRTMPCGTKVTLRHGGRTVRVPVVDRGPYSGGRELDLTAATKDRLGFAGTGTILVAA